MAIRRRSAITRRRPRKLRRSRLLSKRKCVSRRAPVMKKIKSMLQRSKPTKKINYQLAPATGLGSNVLTSLISNLFSRPVLSAGGSYGNPVFAATGGDVPSTAGYFVGDTIDGNRIALCGMSIRGVLRNQVYSPKSYVKLMIIRSSNGTVPSVGTLWKGLCSCKLVDSFNNDDFTLMASKTFRLAPAVHTGNWYLPQSKPGGGTAANDAVGTYWDTPGVSILGNTNDTYDSENIVYFNANTVSGSYAPTTIPFDWRIPPKPKHLVFQEGTEVGAPTGGLGGFCDPSSYTKDYTYGLYAYVYTNDLIGSSPTLTSSVLDELTWEYRFKELS